jgi:hypothetical protein
MRRIDTTIAGTITTAQYLLLASLIICTGVAFFTLFIRFLGI